MARHPQPDDDLADELLLDEICLEFEQQLQANKQPTIESCLERHVEPFRSKLLEQLILLELEHSGSDQHARLQEYASRFPEHTALIRQLEARRETCDPIYTSDNRPGSERGKRIGPYRVLEKIGEGGMGVVYCAEQTRPVRRTVALKLMRPGLDTDQVIARFEAERQALALMDHDHIARVLGAGTLDDGRPFFAMEYVRGAPITDYCDQHRLSVRQRLELFVDVCQAVHHAHQKGIIHRDLKPSNVLVTKVNSRAVPKVIDFGIAKALGQKLTERTMYTNIGSLIGTPAYMSPEQAGTKAHDIDTRSDVYSLGVLAYELLTGSTPLTHERLKSASLECVQSWVREEEVERPSARFVKLSDNTAEIANRRQMEPAKLTHLLRGELDWVLTRALEKDRDRRYESASALADDVQRFLDDEPVEARPPSVSYKIHKFARRNKATLTTAVVILLTLISATAVSTWEAFNATRARAIADERLEREQQALASARSALERAEAAEHAAAKRAEELERRVYVAAIENAIDARDRSDLSAMAKQLDLCTPDLRHWEWNRLRGGRIEIEQSWSVRAHDVVMGVHQARWTPDGTGFVSGGVDRLVKIRDASSRESVQSFRKHGGEVTGVAVSPNAALVASEGRDGVLMVWETDSGDLVWQSTDRDESRGVDISPDGKYVVAADGQSLTLWELVTGDKVWTASSETELEGVRFSPDGTQIITGGYLYLIRESNDVSSGPAKIWDAGTGRQTASLGNSVGVAAATFLPIGNRVAYGTLDGRVVIHDLSAARDVLTFRVRPESEEVKCVAVSPDGRWIAAAGTDQEFGVWSATNGKVGCIAVGHEVGRIRSLEFHPDGDKILSSSTDRTVRAWDLSIRSPRDVELRGHRSGVTGCAFSPDSDRIATTSSDGSVRLWSTATGEELLRIDGAGAEDSSIDFDPSGDHILVAAGQRVFICRASDGTLIREFQGHPQPVHIARFSPDGRLTATAGLDKVVRVFDTRTGRLVHAMMGHDGYAVYSLAFSPNSSRLASGGTGALKIWDVASGQQISELSIQDEDFTSLAFGDTNDIVFAAAHETRQVHAVAVASGDRMASFSGQHFDKLRNIAVSDDGRRLVTGDDRGSVVLWDARTQAGIMRLSPVAAPVLALAISPDNRLVAVARDDATCVLLEAMAPDDNVFKVRKQLAVVQPFVDSLISEVGEPSQMVSRVRRIDDLDRETRPVAVRLAKVPRVHVCEFTSRRGEALWREDRRTEAELLLVQGYLQVKQMEHQLPRAERFRTQNALERLIQFYESPEFDGTPEHAQRWRQVRAAARVAEELTAAEQFAEAGIVEAFAQATFTDEISLNTLTELRELKETQLLNLVDRQATWRYLLEDPPSDWREVGFDDSEWASGPAPLGFGDNREATTLVPGRMAYPFRHSFSVAENELPSASWLRVEFACDDGAAIYLNGQALCRKNVPEGQIDLSMPALGGAEWFGSETTIHPFLLDVGGALRIGQNVLAASVHQSRVSSSDLHFELSLSTEWTAAATLAALRGEERDRVVESAVSALSGTTAEPWAESMRFAFSDGNVEDTQVSRTPEDWLRRGRIQRLLGDFPAAIDAYTQGLASATADAQTQDDLLRECEKVWRLSGREYEASASMRRWVSQQFLDQGSLRINCGGDRYTSKSGVTWNADRFVSAPLDDKREQPIDSDDAPLFRTARWFPYWVNQFHGYRIPVEPGQYRVKLLFAEIEYDAAGHRVFDIRVEGDQLRANYDVCASVGSGRPARVQFDVVSADDLLEIELVPRIDKPMISAMAIQPLK